MLTDLNNSIYRNTTNTGFPSVILNPSQIFGENLWIWYDFDDTKSLFSDTGFTTNVVNSGEVIRGVLNKGNDSNYNLLNDIPNALSGTSQSFLSYNRNSINSNKSSMLMTFTGGSTNGVASVMTSISATSTSSEVISAYTCSGVLRLGDASNSSASILGGFISNRLVVSFVRPLSDTTVTINFPLVGQTMGSMPKRVGERYLYFTYTVNSNNNLYMNVNNRFITSTTISNIYPIIPTAPLPSGRLRIFFYDGTTFTVRSTPNTELLEYCASYRTTLTEAQISSLHQYYKIKYNL